MCEKRNLAKRTSVESPLQMYCNESVVALDATALDDFALLLKVLSMQLLLMLNSTAGLNNCVWPRPWAGLPRAEHFCLFIQLQREHRHARIFYGVCVSSLNDLQK